VASLQEEIAARDRLISELHHKIGRTRHTLESLQAAQLDYHSSAQKLNTAKHRLQQSTEKAAVDAIDHAAAATKPSSKQRPKFDTTIVRRELQEATSMMAAAAKRVEQMEAVTDLLVEQLGERDAEIRELRLERELHHFEAADQRAELDRLTGELRAAQDKRDAMAAGEAAALGAFVADESVIRGMVQRLSELEEERRRQVAEKQASLETMTRAVASAAAEAAMKQEAINRLAAEINELVRAVLLFSALLRL
jgi:chromosome segregation ATPase